MRLLLGKAWPGAYKPQPISGTESTQGQAPSVLFKWVIPLGILFFLVLLGNAAVDADSLVGGAFLAIVAMLAYIVKFRSSINIFGWILSGLVFLMGVSMISEGLILASYTY